MTKAKPSRVINRNTLDDRRRVREHRLVCTRTAHTHTRTHVLANTHNRYYTHITMEELSEHTGGNSEIRFSFLNGNGSLDGLVFLRARPGQANKCLAPKQAVHLFV